MAEVVLGSPVGHVRGESGAHRGDLLHRVGRRRRRDDEASPPVQPQDPCPALAVDAPDDGELLDQEAILVVPVDGIEQLPWDDVHVAGDREQRDPVALRPKLLTDRRGDHVAPHLGAKAPEPSAGKFRRPERGDFHRHLAQLCHQLPDHCSRIPGQPVDGYRRVERLTEQLEAVTAGRRSADLQGDLARLGGGLGDGSRPQVPFLQRGPGLD